MKALAILMVCAAIPAQTWTATPPAYQNWPGDALWSFFVQAPNPSARFETVYDAFPGGAQFTQLAFRPFQNQPAVTVDIQIDVSVGVAPSTAPTWTHNASRTTVFPRQVVNLPGLCTASCGNPPLEPSVVSPWTWNFPLTNFPTTPASGSVYVDITIWSITLTGIGTNVGWVVEGFSHVHSRPGFPYTTNQGRYLFWAALGCGPPSGALVSWWYDLQTDDQLLMLATATPTTSGITDFVNIGAPVVGLPSIPLGTPPVLCQPRIDTSVASYVVPVPQGVGTTMTLASIPWLPAYNYTAMWGQVLRWDAVSGTFLWLTRPHHFTTHYHPGIGVPMPADSRINGVITGAGATKAPVLGWR